MMYSLNTSITKLYAQTLWQTMIPAISEYVAYLLTPKKSKKYFYSQLIMVEKTPISFAECIKKNAPSHSFGLYRTPTHRYMLAILFGLLCCPNQLLKSIVQCHALCDKKNRIIVIYWDFYLPL